MLNYYFYDLVYGIPKKENTQFKSNSKEKWKTNNIIINYTIKHFIDF